MTKHLSLELGMTTDGDIASLHSTLEERNRILPVGNECKRCGQLVPICSKICHHPWIDDIDSVRQTGKLTDEIKALLRPETSRKKVVAPATKTRKIQPRTVKDFSEQKLMKETRGKLKATRTNV